MKADQPKTPLATAIIILILALTSGCLSMSRVGDDPSAVYTAGASTLMARLTLESGQTAVAQLTQNAIVPPAPPTRPAANPPPKQPATATPEAVPSDTAVPRPPSEAEVEQTATPIMPTATPPPAVACNLMEFMGDVTVPANSVFQSGAVVNKVWRVRNIGSCTWSAGYSLVLTGGNLTGAPQLTPLPAVVPPGGIIDLSVAFLAPSIEGFYQGSWMLRSDSGELFGSGATRALPLSVGLSVFRPVAERPATYDIASNYCAGTWTSQVGQLPCPSSTNNPNGSVVLVQRPRLESGRSTDYGLWTRPNLDADGWISGRTALIPIRSSDHFLAEIGCMADSPDCEVIFQLDYQTNTGITGRLGRWRENSDGLTTFVNVDLASLAGQTASLSLTVYNRGRARQANAFWLMPRIQTGSFARTNLVTWTREGFPDSDSCDELHIFRTGVEGATAVAYDCSDGTFELGRATLTTGQVNQLLDWEDRLDFFEGEVYSVTSGRPVHTWVIFNGLGDETATNTNIETLQRFAAQIFDQLAR